MDIVTTQHIEQSLDVADIGYRTPYYRTNVVIWHERMGLSADEIASNYGLSLADVYAALTY